MKSERVKLIEKLVDPKKSDRVLNIGIGWVGDVEEALQDQVKEMWTADIDQRKIEKAKKKLKNTNVVFINAEKRFPVKDGYFDKIILLDVLEHLKYDKQALININHALKKEGYLIIGVPERNFNQAISPLNYIVHYRHYSKKSISKLLKEVGFKIESLDMVGSWIASLNLYFILILRYLFRMKVYEDILLTKQYGRTWVQGRKKGMGILIKAKKIN